jgi:hypothetical protein
MGVSRSALMVDFSRAGAENASLTPSKRPICSCVVEIFWDGKTAHADTDDPIRTAARQIDRGVMMLLLSAGTGSDLSSRYIGMCGSVTYFVRRGCQQAYKSDCC